MFVTGVEPEQKQDELFFGVSEELVWNCSHED